MEKVDRSFVKPINSIQEAYGALLVEDLDYAEDSDENFVKTKEGVLTAATLNKLVAQVTSFDTCGIYIS